MHHHPAPLLLQPLVCKTNAALPLPFSSGEGSCAPSSSISLALFSLLLIQSWSKETFFPSFFLQWDRIDINHPSTQRQAAFGLVPARPLAAFAPVWLNRQLFPSRYPHPDSSTSYKLSSPYCLSRGSLLKWLESPKTPNCPFWCCIASLLPCLTFTLHLLSLPHLKGWGRNPRETPISLSHVIVTKNSSHTGETWICPAQATGLWTHRTSIQPCFYRSIALLASSSLQFRAFWSQKGTFAFTSLKASSPSPSCII